ncbi:MFS transporter [Rhodococcus sp. P1Y]|uniref:MFS transporter n=1 Tax=Rhodococcus sp. P1Y TaxID=1302308 RepID=UPI0019134596|nr:MFS transporter [Rhodococcus sp. P1Y]
MTSKTETPAGPGWRQEITRVQWLVLFGTTMGWALDGFAGSLYALVLGPAMTELLPNSGIDVDSAHIGLYGGMTVALFLAGWATGGILFGVLADYFGRVRVLSIGILTYALFTALAAFADTWWQLGILRFIAGLGSGVEAPVGAALVAEVWKNKYRARACGVMMSGYAGGFFIAALAYSMLSSQGWRFMLVLAVVPAFLVWFLRRYVPEPEEIKNVISTRKARKSRGIQRPEDQFVLRRLLAPPNLRATLICTALATGSLLAFWSVSTWYPQIIRNMSSAESLSTDIANHRVAISSMLFNAGGILGYATWGFLADAIGRRKAFLVSFVVSGLSIAYLFPFEHSYTTYLIVIPIVGFGLFGALSGNFVYGPEMFSPSMRASGIALANSIGRYITAAGPLVAGVIATSWFGGNLGVATAVLASTGIIALVGLYFAPETRDAALPTDPHHQHHADSTAPAPTTTVKGTPA